MQVTSINRKGPSAPAVSAASYAIPISVPAAPEIRKVAYQPGARAKVMWQAPADGGSRLTGYVVTATPGGRSCTAKGSQSSCVVPGLAGGREYSFTVRARNSVGTGPASPPATAGLLVAPSSRPQGVSVSVAGSSATVSWSKPRSNGGGRLLQFVVRSSPDGPSCTTRTTSCLLGGLALGRTYTFAVSAVNTAGVSKAASASATVPAPQPAPPPDKPEQQLS